MTIQLHPEAAKRFDELGKQLLIQVTPEPRLRLQGTEHKRGHGWAYSCLKNRRPTIQMIERQASEPYTTIATPLASIILNPALSRRAFQQVSSGELQQDR